MDQELLERAVETLEASAVGGVIPTRPATTLQDALHKAQADVGVAAKGDRNDHGGYDYSSRESIVGHAKAVLIAHGLHFTFLGPVEADADTATWRASLHYPANSEELTWPVRWSIDYNRKGMTREQRVGTAQSYAEKYQLLSLLQIPRGGEELDAMSNREREPVREVELSPEQVERREFWGLVGESPRHLEIAGQYAAENELKGKSKAEWSLDDVRRARVAIEEDYPV